MPPNLKDKQNKGYGMFSKEFLFRCIPREKREWNQTVAKWFGYFWIPCSVCGEYFAGFEWLEGHTIQRGCEGEGVCYKLECKNEARKRSFFVPVTLMGTHKESFIIYDPKDDPGLYPVEEDGRTVWKYKN